MMNQYNALVNNTLMSVFKICKQLQSSLWQLSHKAFHLSLRKQSVALIHITFYI